MVLSVFPIVYLYAYWNVRKLGLGILLNLGIGVLSWLIQYLLGFPWGIIATFGISIPLNLHFMKKWSTAWNESIDKQNFPPSS